MSTLLVVDDNQQNLYLLQVLLSANGFQVELAANGAEALEKARRAPPDMIISDILMPVMDGFSLCRAWKEDERLKHIPFVFYTATYTDPKDEEFALSLGADRFIIKPVEPDRFLALLSETWKDYKTGRPVAPPQPVEEAEHYKEYNAVLIRKLEDKMLQLEEANRILEHDITERKRAEARAQEGERFARKINESSLNGIYIYDIEREEIVYINHECERLTGYTPRDLPTKRGEAFFSLFLPEARLRVREYITEVSQAGDGETREIECHFKTADGRWIWCLSRNAVFERDKAGKARAIIGTFLDVTARKQAEEALGQAHERAIWLARFPEENPNPVVRVSADGQVLYRNPAAAELPGWACEVGKPLPELLLPIVAKAMAEGREAEEDVQLGERFHSVWVAPFPRESYANVYGRDITDRKEAEQERERLLALVQERNAEMDAVFAAMQDAVVIYDMDMNVRRVNPMFIPIYGFDPVGLNVREMIQRTQCRWLDGRPFRLEEQPTPRALRGEMVLNQRFLITGLDGAEMALETSSAPLRVGDRVVGTVTVWHDITERKRAEEWLRQVNAELAAARDEAVRETNRL